MTATPTIDERIAALEDIIQRHEVGATDHLIDIKPLRRELLNLKKHKFSNLTPWEMCQLSRHQKRPQLGDYVELIFEDFFELHGDRTFGDDAAIKTGMAKVNEYKVMVIGHDKGRTLAQKKNCNFGCAHPEGYRKALKQMRFAGKFGLPIVCFIDTPGAFPGIGAEERGQANIIAYNLLEMSRIPTPIVCVVIGEGGSGGALGIGIGDRIYMLEYSYYSVISPEGCAGILWKTATDENKNKAAEQLNLTANQLYKFAIVDDIIKEPLGGSHLDYNEIAANVKQYILRGLRELLPLNTTELLDQRYAKYRKMGIALN